MQKTFYSNGKLLLSGEYVILDGAQGLAVPTRYGQSLHITENDSGELTWKGLDEKNSIWFQATFSIPNLEIKSTTDNEIATRLQSIFHAVRLINGEFLAYETGLDVETQLTFPKNWGLGTSSTLINNIADWAMIDAHFLLEETFGGSGYDISCAQYDSPILYNLKEGIPNVEEVVFNPEFKDALFFIYLNQKRNSRDAISAYKERRFDKAQLISEISSITQKMVEAQNLSAFEALVTEHEQLLSKILDTKTVKTKLFPDYPGALKSLGAWGGDFILATGDHSSMEYFRSKGFQTIIPFQDMVL